MRPIDAIKTIDAEVAGEAVRLIVSGGPSVPGRSMAEKLRRLRKSGEELRQFLMLEPRGHSGMHGALLTDPVTPQAAAGVLSMHAAGFPPVSGEGVVAAVTLALEHGLIHGEFGELPIDTPAGVARVRPHFAPGSAETSREERQSRVARVELTGFPSFVHSAGLALQVGTRKVMVDVAYGGEFYAIADSEAIGIPIDMSNAVALVRMGREIKEAVESTVHVAHPGDATLSGIHGTIFTGAPRAAGDLRSATVLDGEVLRRSPGVTGTAAIMAVLDAMGLLVDDQSFTHEGILGTVMKGRAASRQQIGGIEALTPVIEGEACVTGYHEFVRHYDRPLGLG
jgi:trans-L-3-hydroxyproline dehydratase